MQDLYRRSALLIVIVCTFSACGPFGPFDPAKQPPPPNYDSSANWLCRPDTQDGCDHIIRNSGLEDRQATAEADCFAVSPTVHFIGATWNADPQAIKLTAELVAVGMFSAFNGTCKIYSPLYRQFHLGALLGGEEDSFRESSLLAYNDVERAFDYYLEHWNEGRPFFLVSHSQGSMHVEKLVQERIEGTALADSLVAAYIVGGTLQPDAFTEIPYCNDAQETGCAMGWNAVAEDYTGGGIVGVLEDLIPGDQLCTNPLSWTVGGVDVPASENPGSGGMDPFGIVGIEPGLVGASCRDDGLLAIYPLPPASRYIPIAQGDYHLWDYGLFYISIRENAQDRLDSYLATPPQTDWGAASVMGVEYQSTSDTFNYLFFVMVPVGVLLLRKTLRNSR